MSAVEHHFLIIDRDTEIRRQISEYLESCGHRQIYEASRVREALEVLNREPVTCIIAEWNLPKATGYSLLKLVRAQTRYKALVFLLMSEADLQHQEKILRAASQKVDGFMLKPFTLKTLERLLHSSGVS